MASLSLAVEIFDLGVTSSLFSWIIRQIFDLKGNSLFLKEMKDKSLLCLIKRKDPDSILLLKELLEADSTDSARMEFLIEHLPPVGNFQF